MEKKLSEIEEKVALAIAQGQNARQIAEWYGITYKEYVNCKRRILRKLKIKRMTQILPVLIKNPPSRGI